MYNFEQVGLLTPEPCSTGKLLTGQVGYIITGMKSTKLAQIGDTWHRAKKPVEPLPGFKQSKSMIFAGESATLIADFAFPGLLVMQQACIPSAPVTQKGHHTLISYAISTRSQRVTTTFCKVKQRPALT